VTGAVVVGAFPEELDPAAVGREVCVSETRLPVRVYAAAQAARDIPLGQHQLPPELSWVQKNPEAQELPVPSVQHVS